MAKAVLALFIRVFGVEPSLLPKLSQVSLQVVVPISLERLRCAFIAHSLFHLAICVYIHSTYVIYETDSVATEYYNVGVQSECELRDTLIGGNMFCSQEDSAPKYSAATGDH